MSKIKKIFIQVCLLISACLFFASPAFAEEQINDFTVDIKINKDASIEVDESIAYDFGTEQKHGIFRDLPYKYKNNGGNFKLRYSDFSVTDGEGKAVEFKIESKGNDKRLKIGDADVFVTGAMRYVLHYKVERAINYFADYDELYWNATGNNWITPISRSKTTVTLPESVNKESLRSICYTGVSGSTAECVSSRLNFSAENMVDKLVFTDDSLRAHEGVTVVIGLPKGVVKKPSVFKTFFEIAKDNYIILLPFFVFYFLFISWKKNGRDPKGRGTIVAQFDAPDNLSPAEIGTIVDEKAQQKDISAEIINLAVRGYLKIEKIQEKNILQSDDYELTKLKNESAGLNEYQKTLVQALFGNDNKIKLSDLKNKFFKDLQLITKKVYQSVVEKGYFLSNPNSVRIKYFVFGIVIVFLGFLFGQFFGIIGYVSFALSGLLIMIFGNFMPKKSEKGVLAREHILGLKTYLNIAEKDRINFHNAPEKNPQIFEKLLPFAMVLGVEAAWAKQFENIYQTNPSWYSDANMGNFSVLAFTNSLGGFQSSTNTIMASTASSGGSGFSGGDSGGGFGGGGGGSW
ncbi:MAG: hypothetical protein US83_C0005G0070 [Candidatus Falkowbacteria bacterium GW2011_GWC2_38_22]|uniref:DUF2207 domain-containing protein n=1 Tax=Candidatus Falkowbacteria bacterium GW2011_GWE1_38_31 TaxID=1618638 RepID=A0A0G0M9H1_9BACT|nr:MAG: hypothetical protein US73_C0003G0024 [Candidatus Falkowbacteria bacterium GW2011_GWF2_38_1205]KKQ61557.1 MAG: hypothetical protein US83_C0005G0070 [Candidatus Falkowbacteria bacterium GW2011_GWC2_38_22]KKQ63550.1 MAG: hypothetical protein US84_C0005G0024 [Candidatus Falkowbacteria bacterium GW2011_GWF1_38_22]KKQ65702.1 MAG: hypothetical protein US87_C0005G0024 [Candidatus Falkowbacteria bacterium GW2011_GWE2_38_254]KKQ70319.1 MAG: hypothetical protein US91_C0005G0024 [Candidatus Falkowb